jgi:hypothetical protein
MTLIDLYQFIDKNSLEYNETDDDLILFVDFIYLKEWTDLLGYSPLDEGTSTVQNNLEKY